MKVSDRCKIILPIFLFFASQGYSQLIKSGYCMLDNFSFIPDSVNNLSAYNPSPGFTLKGQHDSLFSFTQGVVAEVQHFENGFYKVKILARHHYSIDFLRLKNTPLKAGDNIGIGWYIGSLDKHEGYCYPWLMIWKRSAFLSREKSCHYLIGVCKRMCQIEEVQKQVNIKPMYGDLLR